MKPLIVMALHNEGQGKLEALGFDVLYCGVGKVNAAYHLTRMLHASGKTFPYVLNLGSAGSRVHNAGAVVAADRFVQRDMDVTGLGFQLGVTPFEDGEPMIVFPRLMHHLPHGICASGDSFVQGALPMSADIVDMEAYALAKVCQRESLPFACVKYITDGADHNASADWQENLARSAEAFSALLAEELQRNVA